MFATRKICQGRTSLSKIQKVAGFRIEIYDSIDKIEESWSLVSAAHDIFYGVAFLRSVERFPPSGITPYYGVVSRGNEPVGIIYMQHIFVKLGNHLRKPGGQGSGLYKHILSSIKHVVVGAVNFHTIVCGNLMLTGRYGYYFKESVSNTKQVELVSSALTSLQDVLTEKGISTGLVLIKDFFEKDIPVQGEKPLGYTKFTVQPKMMLTLKSHWKNFDDYLEDLKSKYRVRARKAFGLAGDIEKKEFDASEIAAHREKIHSLYRNISDQATFNAFILHKRYFENLKEALGDQMKFTTYWKSGEMVAFFTTIRNYDILDAHFLGYDPHVNTSSQLYQNMLYDLIKEGISMRAHIVDMSRTAIEIKSTVGATPYPMYLFLKHNHPLLNRAVKTIIGFVKPDEDFIIREPFREEAKI